jgi:hypothetical protein
LERACGEDGNPENKRTTYDGFFSILGQGIEV